MRPLLSTDWDRQPNIVVRQGRRIAIAIVRDEGVTAALWADTGEQLSEEECLQLELTGERL